jgi:cold shock CspA family protein
MRFEGALATWNTERGFGSLSPQQGGQGVFVHISAFPRDGPPPALDETFSFEVVSGRDGRKQAAKVQRSQQRSAAVLHSALAPAPPRQHGRQRSPWFMLLMLLLLVLGLTVGAAALAWWQFTPPTDAGFGLGEIHQSHQPHQPYQAHQR